MNQRRLDRQPSGRRGHWGGWGSEPGAGQPAGVGQPGCRASLGAGPAWVPGQLGCRADPGRTPRPAGQAWGPRWARAVTVAVVTAVRVRTAGPGPPATLSRRVI